MASRWAVASFLSRSDDGPSSRRGTRARYVERGADGRNGMDGERKAGDAKARPVRETWSRYFVVQTRNGQRFVCNTRLTAERGSVHASLTWGNSRQSLLPLSDEARIIAKVGMPPQFEVAALYRVGNLPGAGVFMPVPVAASREFRDDSGSSIGGVPVLHFVDVDLVARACELAVRTNAPLCAFRTDGSVIYGDLVDQRVRNARISCAFPHMDYGYDGCVIYACLPGRLCGVREEDCWFPVAFCEGFSDTEGSSHVICRLFDVCLMPIEWIGWNPPPSIADADVSVVRPGRACMLEPIGK